jgi:hypothetical protein
MARRQTGNDGCLPVNFGIRIFSSGIYQLPQSNQRENENSEFAHSWIRFNSNMLVTGACGVLWKNILLCLWKWI